MEKKVYVTTSIPYVNASPHIGYALEAVQSDALIRHYRHQKYNAYFLSGTDENAMKNVESAEKAGIPTKEFVDKNAQAFFQLKEALNLSFDGFIRTTEKKHAEGAQKIWDLCKKDIYKKTYTGLYCVGCETFYKDGEFPDNICPDHNRKLETVSEENYFFALSRYTQKLKDLIKSGTLKVVPEFRLPEILNYLEDGLEDFSISRPAERVKKWGIPVPGDESQYMYVWFDALTNYITALDFNTEGDLYKTYWKDNPNRFHVIGKNITKFHLLYWPAMLLSAGINLPTKVYVHGFITMDGKKMSKSIGNVVDPFEVVKQYGTDAVRFYLLREIPSLDDGDFSYRRMEEIYNSDLANELGNMVMRVTTIAEKDGLEFQPDAVTTDAKVVEFTEAYQFNLALELVFSWVKDHNKEIDDFAPWKKTAEERKEFLTKSLNTIYRIAVHLQPFLPETASKIITTTQGKIQKIAPLFPKKIK